jgi:hypothetical protein
MSSQEEATAAIDSLDDRYTWPGMTAPMVVKWMDSDLQRQRRWAGLATPGAGGAAARAAAQLRHITAPPACRRRAASPPRPACCRERYQASIRQAKAARNKAAPLPQMVPLQLLLNAGAAAVAAAAQPQHTSRTKPPAGCAPDAIKLFVGGPPLACLPAWCLVPWAPALRRPPPSAGALTAQLSGIRAAGAY